MTNAPADAVRDDPAAAITVRALARQWRRLPAPPLDALTGDLAASFARPLQRVAPAGLGLIGLRRWSGKRFVLRDGSLAGANLVRSADGTAEVLPMTAGPGVSLLDGRPVVAVTYAPDAPRPWRWVRDELRVRPDGVVVGMTCVDLPGLRRLGGTPFLLRRVTGDG